MAKHSAKTFLLKAFQYLKRKALGESEWYMHILFHNIWILMKVFHIGKSSVCQRCVITYENDFVSSLLFQEVFIYDTVANSP